MQGLQFFRDLGRIEHKAPLLEAGSLQRSCWMLHTHPPTHPQVDPNPMKVLLPVGDQEKRLSCNVGFLGTAGCPGLVLFFAEVLHWVLLVSQEATLAQSLSRAGLGLVRVSPSNLLPKAALARPCLPFFPPVDSGDYLCHPNNTKPGPITVLQQLEDRNSPRNSPSCLHNADRRRSEFSSAIRQQNQDFTAPSSECL